MIKTTVSVSGMACNMCEAHVNNAVRKVFPNVKVTSSHKKGETVILSDSSLDHEAVKKAIDDTGYEVKGIAEEPYEKKGLFGIFK